MSDKEDAAVKLRGEYHLPLDTETTWERLNQPAVLQYCIKGCDEVIEHERGSYTARFVFGFGPLKKNIDAQLTVEDISPPDRYQLVAGLRTRRLGHASGVASVRLISGEGGCQLQYVADVEVSGWFAKFGNDVVEAAAARAMQRFFDRFVTLVE